MLVLVEKTNWGYRAASGKPLEAETEGATREEALFRLRDLLAHRLRGSVEIVDLEIPGELPPKANPWLHLHGAFQNDPSFEEWQSIIRDERRIEDEAAGIFPEVNR